MDFHRQVRFLDRNGHFHVSLNPPGQRLDNDEVAEMPFEPAFVAASDNVPPALGKFRVAVFFA